MKVRTDTYEYAPENELAANQYRIDDFCDGGIVDAVYRHSETNPRNPFVEALPPPRNSKQCRTAYRISIADYDVTEIPTMSDDDRIQHLYQILNYRIPLSFDSVLEKKMYQSLVSSYSNRYILTADKIGLTNATQGQENNAKMCTDRYSSTVGWCLLGQSGTGKSSAIDILKSHYPQTIRHHGSYGQMTQIVYIEVCCPPNSNFSILYTEIGAEIDKALGITTSIYENLVRKSKDKFTIVKQLIETFAIGIIIFDEIQEIDFSGTKTNTFTTLTTLSQVTGAAIAVCGLESAYDQMFKKYYTGRRVGTPINSNNGCCDETIFNKVVDMLFVYQWFDVRITPSAQLKHALYTYSCGVIDALVTMYILMHLEYFRTGRDNRCSVDVHLLEKVIDKHYGKLRSLLAKVKNFKEKNGDFDADFVAIQSEARKNAKKLMAPDEIKEMKEVIERPATLDSAQLLAMMQGNVVKNIHTVLPSIDKKDIVSALQNVLDNKKSKELSEAEISEIVIQKLLGTGKAVVKKQNHKADINLLRQNLVNAYK